MTVTGTTEGPKVMCPGCGRCVPCRLAARYPSYRKFVGSGPWETGWTPAPVPEGAVMAPPAKGSKPLPTSGPGSELKALLGEFGITATSSCGCNAFAAQMDRWGVDGTRTHRAKVVAWLDQRRARTSLGPKLRAWLAGAANAVTGGFVPDPNDVSGSLVDEAIRRAEVKCGAVLNVLPSNG